ncbi:helix-turn-helix domain-containing protein [Cohnella nanjingensis]|nr:AraC family transcriptional regulator [Cohnella nanjingensis]
MPAKPMDWMQGPWSARLHTVRQSSYEQLRIEDQMYPNWIISYVKAGRVTTAGTDGGRIAVRAGDVMLHPPNLPFSEYADGAGTHLWMQAAVLCSHQFDLFRLLRISPVVTLSDPIRFEAAFAKLLEAWRHPAGAFRDLTLTSLALQLTAQILEGWERAGRPERPETSLSTEDRFSRLVHQMSLRLHEKLTREELGSLVRLSPNYLDKAFRRQYGLTPMQMLRDLRLSRARQLLERSEAPLESVAERCGFADASYLCKQFKRQYGLLPGEYRESARSARTEDMYGGRGAGPMDG